jgi:hypothetical protein
MTFKISGQGFIWLILFVSALVRNYSVDSKYFNYIIVGFVAGAIFGWFNYEGFQFGSKKKGNQPQVQNAQKKPDEKK